MNPRPAITASARRTYARSGRLETTRPVTELIKEMGSKRGWDPIPPSQYEWQGGAGEPPLYRMWSWLCCHILAADKRNASALRNDGSTAGLKDLADDLGMDLGQASNLWKFGQARGIWYKHNGREMRLRGEVTSADVAEANIRRNVECTLNLSARDLLIIKSWPKELQNQFFAAWEPAQTRNREYVASKLAEARAACGLRDDSMRRMWCLPPKVGKLGKISQLADNTGSCTSAQLSVHQGTAHSTPLECTGGEERGENVSVQSGLSLCTSDKYQTLSAAAANLSTTAEAAQLASELHIPEAAAATLLLRSRTVNRDVEVAELVELARHYESGAKLNRIGFMLAAVPEKATGATLDAARERIRRRIINGDRAVTLDPFYATGQAQEELAASRAIFGRCHGFRPGAWDDDLDELQVSLAAATLALNPHATDAERAWAAGVQSSGVK